jgi:hypothetical protein
VTRLTSKHLYGFYVSRGGTLSWAVWSSILAKFNQAAMDAIIYEGKELDMGMGLSRLSVLRIDRNFALPRVDWPATKILKRELVAEGKELFSEENQDGAPYLVYFTDEWYCRFFWEKRNCKVKNVSAYRFDASRGLKGNKGKLIAHLKSDSLAHLIYDKAHK